MDEHEQANNFVEELFFPGELEARLQAAEAKVKELEAANAALAQQLKKAAIDLDIQRKINCTQAEEVRDLTAKIEGLKVAPPTPETPKAPAAPKAARATTKKTEHVKEPANASQQKAIEFATEKGLDARMDGSWLWIAGNTKPVKEDLKALGARWSSRRKEWYLAA